MGIESIIASEDDGTNIPKPEPTPAVAVNACHGAIPNHRFTCGHRGLWLD